MNVKSVLGNPQLSQLSSFVLIIFLYFKYLGLSPLSSSCLINVERPDHFQETVKLTYSQRPQGPGVVRNRVQSTNKRAKIDHVEKTEVASSTKDVKMTEKEMGKVGLEGGEEGDQKGEEALSKQSIRNRNRRKRKQAEKEDLEEKE